jgi:predicted transglutaminase-like cysteine proteinase
MFARTTALAIATFVFVLLADLGVGPRGVLAQNMPTSVLSAASADGTKSTTPAVIQMEPFGLATTVVSTGSFATMWGIMANQIRVDREVLMRCRQTTELCSAAASNFLAIAAEGREHTGRARIGVINRAINLTIQATNVNHWTAPLETFAMGRGNCKQYAITKYLALIEAGISEDDVRLVIVRDLAAGDNHAVVAVRLNSDWIMLDNRWLNMVRDTDMRGVIPLFVLDRHGVKQFSPKADGGLS